MYCKHMYMYMYKDHYVMGTDNQQVYHCECEDGRSALPCGIIIIKVLSTVCTEV